MGVEKLTLGHSGAFLGTSLEDPKIFPVVFPQKMFVSPEILIYYGS